MQRDRTTAEVNSKETALLGLGGRSAGDFLEGRGISGTGKKWAVWELQSGQGK